MKKYLFLVFWGVAGFLVFDICTSYKEGPANWQGEGFTGAPCESGSLCGHCHRGGNFGTTSQELYLIDKNCGDTLDFYRSGVSYRVLIRVVSPGAAPRYGFQLTALDSENKDFGNWINPGSDVQISPVSIDCGDLSGNLMRTYVEHDKASFSNTFEVEWQAPMDRADSVFFYMNGNAVNGDGSTSNDKGGFGTVIAMSGQMDSMLVYTLPEDSIKGSYFANSGINNQGTVYATDKAVQHAGDSIVFNFPFLTELGADLKVFVN